MNIAPKVMTFQRRVAAHMMTHAAHARGEHPHSLFLEYSAESRKTRPQQSKGAAFNARGAAPNSAQRAARASTSKPARPTAAPVTH
jgi:hypothetical protein